MAHLPSGYWRAPNFQESASNVLEVIEPLAQATLPQSQARKCAQMAKPHTFALHLGPKIKKKKKAVDARID
jgi:hypothetical protein